METIERCLHQVFRTTVSLPEELRTNGDCKNCKYDEENKNCKNYQKIKINLYNVK